LDILFKDERLRISTVDRSTKKNYNNSKLLLLMRETQLLSSL